MTRTQDSMEGIDKAQSAEYQLQEDLLEEPDVGKHDEILSSFIHKMETQVKLMVPDFDKDLDWLNTAEPLSFQKELKNKIVVLDFFTYCCVNCLHILPDLECLHEKYPPTDGVVIIGVHSAKFANEKIIATILSAVLRYNITHAVVNDYNTVLWNKLQISCWPTLVVVSPTGHYLRSFVGEGHKESLSHFLELALKYYRAKGELSSHDVQLALEKNKIKDTQLKFPGKVTASSDGKSIIVADTGHNRILVLEKNGIVKCTIGGKQRGYLDGNFEDSLFNGPQGVAIKKDVIYVADTENHVIRKVDLHTRTVTTVAGTGQQGQDKEGGQLGTLQELSSPWDLILGQSVGSNEQDILFIAMAGSHQIWALFLEDGKWFKGRDYKAGTCVRVVGSGKEENRNNSYPEKASLAQPSGITLSYNQDINAMYVADSESSTVRSVSLKDGAVKAFVGGERDPTNLFAYGDTDDVGIQAKLQHPLAVTMVTPDCGPLLVADSYNHKIKSVDLKTKSCETLKIPDSRKDDAEDSVEYMDLKLSEPAGLYMDQQNSLLYIADTNNHCIKVLDWSSRSMHELPVIFPNDAIKRKPSKVKKDFVKPGMALQETEPVAVPPGGNVEVRLNLALPNDVHLTEEAPSRWMLICKGDENEPPVALDCDTEGSIKDTKQQVLVMLKPPETQNSNMSLYVKCRVFYCDTTNVCSMKETVFKQGLVVSEGDAVDGPSVKQVTLDLTLS